MTPNAAVRRGPLRSSLVACACLLRALPLFFRAAPKTPLRVLCIVALDTMQKTITALTTEITKSQSHLDRVRANEERGSAAGA
jgi:hypothetical protein